MADDAEIKPSFSPRRKLSIAVDLLVRVLVVLAVVVMVNYLGARYFQRLYLSSQTRIELSSRTVNILKNLTNSVKVTLYFDKDNDLYPTISALLDEYQKINPRITIQTVDYTRDAAEAQRIKAAYKLGVSSGGTEKDLVIFDCDGHSKIAPGKKLADYALKEVPNSTNHEAQVRPIAFKGEEVFTSMLLAVTNPKPLKAYFLEGDGEHPIDSTDQNTGYSICASVFEQNYIQVASLSLRGGTNDVPADCNLLVIAGPTTPFDNSELDKIENYLDQGGRLFVLFNAFSRNRPTGLEKLLGRWGVVVDGSVVQDKDNSVGGSGVIVTDFSQHPVVNPLLGSPIELVLPRSIRAQKSSSSVADAPKVEEIAFAGPHAVLVDDPTHEQRRWPLAVAVEKGAPKGVITERGSTRILVIGDSFFLANGMIRAGVNADFAGYAANWLLERTKLLKGMGPRPVTEFRLDLTRVQVKAVEWILLAGLPGAVLLLGVLVWLRRRS